MENTNRLAGKWMGGAFVVIVAVLAYSVLTMPDTRTTSERIGDAVGALPQGVDKAADAFKDRTPGQKIGDAVKDAGENIKEHTGNH